jgi:hypothetical protein
MVKTSDTAKQQTHDKSNTAEQRATPQIDTPLEQ